VSGKENPIKINFSQTRYKDEHDIALKHGFFFKYVVHAVGKDLFEG
jgi:hypothetical protein